MGGNSEILFAILSYAIPIFGIVVLGLLIGGSKERRHLRNMTRREQASSHVKVTNLKRITDPGGVEEAWMVLGQVVIATDYFKTFATGLRNLVGGEMKSAQMLLTRGRREALLRAIETAQARGATELWNVRFNTSSISQMNGNRGAMQVEVFTWATAVKRKSAQSIAASPGMSDAR